MGSQPPKDTKPLPPKKWLHPLSTWYGLTILASVSLSFVAMAILGGVHVFDNRSTYPTLELGEKPLVSINEQALHYPKLAPLLNDARLGSIYKDFLIAYQEGGVNTATDLARKRGLLNEWDEVVLTLTVDASEANFLKEKLEFFGIKVTTVSGNLMDIAIPLEIIHKSIDDETPGGIFDDLTGLKHVQELRMPSRVGVGERFPMPIPDLNLRGFDVPVKVGKVDSESLHMIGAINWQNAGFTGEGIKVGILDMGFDKYKGLLGSDLPANVTARSFVYGKEIDKIGNEHGTAVAEIVYDIAPDAELVFAAYSTEAEGNRAVNWLLSQDVDIIQNSTGYIEGPFDGSSTVSKLVDQVVGNGVIWVNSAGNDALGHYRGSFSDYDGDGIHNFDSNGSELLPFTTPNLGIMCLNWDDWKNGTQDFDLYIFDEKNKQIASSRNTQNGSGSYSSECLNYQFPTFGPYYAAFNAKNTSRAVTFDFFVIDGEVELPSAEYSINKLADARRSLTIGAVNWKNDVLEDYSSQGPTHDGRLKPELVAPTRVTSVAYDRVWYGTSASAPHVSGAVALVLQAFPDYSPDQVIKFLEQRAINLGSSGPDNAYGYGRLWLGYDPEIADLPTATVMVETQAPEDATPTKQQTKTPSLIDGEDSKISLSFLIFVAIPGLLGLGGLGVLGSILYRYHWKPTTPPFYPMPVNPPFIPPAECEQPWINPRVEGKNICQRCGSDHRPQARFCAVCGFNLRTGSPPERVAIYCRYCGQALHSTSRFCPRCGRAR